MPRPLLFVLLSAVTASSPIPSFAEDQCREIYRAEERNLTGWRHILGGAPIDETVEFDGFDLVLNTSGKETRFRTIGGGTGIQTRLAIGTMEGKEVKFSYMFYDLKGHHLPGTPDHFLLVEGDLYWPECVASALPSGLMGHWESDPQNCSVDEPKSGTAVDFSLDTAPHYSFVDHAGEGGDCAIDRTDKLDEGYSLRVRCQAEESGYGEPRNVGVRLGDGADLLWVSELGDEDTFFRCPN